MACKQGTLLENSPKPEILRKKQQAIRKPIKLSEIFEAEANDKEEKHVLNLDTLKHIDEEDLSKDCLVISPLVLSNPGER